jgi:hypothetical protein
MPYSSFKQSGLDGFKSKKIKRILGNPPGKPLGISATDVGTGRGYNNGAANISFTKGAGEEPLYYLVSASPGNITVNTQSTSFLFEGLNSNVSYVFTVTAVNDAGVSEVSDSSSSTLITTVPETPILSSVSYGYRRLTSSFSSVNNGGKSIINYTMSASPNTATSASAGSITISNIGVGTYPVLIFASNANGNSLNSNIINESPFDVSGGAVSTSGNDRIHTFTGSSNLIVTGNNINNFNYLIIAGGGGGGGGPGEQGGSGGGAGGVRSTVSNTGQNTTLESQLIVAPNTYSVTVGAGGSPGNTGTSLAATGNTSSFSTITSTGGGGGNQVTQTGGNGGSGGAGNGVGIAGQGNNGGPTRGGSQGGHRGGGAGATGANGGTGITNSISGSSVAYAGGGGGGNGFASPAGGGVGVGSGVSVNGGGAGGGGAGTANTGGGGGGATNDVEGSGVGGSGGSGIVILRYAV